MVGHSAGVLCQQLICRADFDEARELYKERTGHPPTPNLHAAGAQALITAGAAVSLALQIFGASPVEPSKPLIDFSLVLLLLPVLLVGV